MSAVVEKTLAPGTDRTLQADFSGTATNFGTVLSSVVWSIISGSEYATLGTSADNLAGGTSVVPLNSSSLEGSVVVKALATFADGQEDEIWFRVNYYAAQEDAAESVTLVPQDYTGTVTNANTYQTLTEFKSYCNLRGYNVSGKTDTQLSRALVLARDYVDARFQYIGRKLYGRDQVTEWPRTEAWDRDRNYVDGIPREVKEAQAEYAYRASTSTLNPDPTREDNGQIVQSKSEKVGPISESVTYVNGGAYTLPRYPAADLKLQRAGFVVMGGQIRRG